MTNPKWIFISDVHVKEEGDEASLLLERFFAIARTSDVSRVYLLGDIFDLMVGGFEEYKREYPTFFKSLRELIALKKEVYYFEGNHDFQNEDLFKAFKKSLGAEAIHFHYSNQDLIFEEKSGRYYIGHGDSIEIENPTYQIYKKIVNSRFCTLLMDQILLYPEVQKIGRWASNESRKKNSQKYEHSIGVDLVKDRFRRSALLVFEKFRPQFIICGHSHVQDSFQIAPDCIYLNNGYAPFTKTYLELQNGRWSFNPL